MPTGGFCLRRAVEDLELAERAERTLPLQLVVEHDLVAHPDRRGGCRRSGPPHRIRASSARGPAGPPRRCRPAATGRAAVAAAAPFRTPARPAAGRRELALMKIGPLEAHACRTAARGGGGGGAVASLSTSALNNSSPTAATFSPVRKARWAASAIGRGRGRRPPLEDAHAGLARRARSARADSLRACRADAAAMSARGAGRRGFTRRGRRDRFFEVVAALRVDVDREDRDVELRQVADQLFAVVSRGPR